jgi:DNA-binding NarL/FixJ family response regulator
MDTIVVVDDHAPFRTRARAMLETEGFEVLAEAGDVASALEAIRRTHPDVVLVDIGLTDGDGFHLAEQLAAWRPAERPIVVLTSSREAGVYQLRIAAAPVAGFVPKDDVSGDVLRALVARANAARQ